MTLDPTGLYAMKKSRIPTVFIMLLIMIFMSQASWAARAYITDSAPVPLRSAPNKQKKAIATLPPGTSVEVLKAPEWTMVRYTPESGDPKNGWVPTSSIGSRPPEETLTKELEAENSALKEKLANLEREKNELTQKQNELSEKLGKLTGSYESLKNGSADYLKLKQEYDSAKSTLSSAQENIQTLMQENENLKLSQKIKWFGAGGLVLVLGWFIGWITGRQGKKRRSSYFF